MSIAELFYAKQQARQARWFQQPSRRSRPAARHRRILLEPLEPRLLLSADPLKFMPVAAMDLTVRLVDEANVPTIQLVDNGHGGAVVESRALADTSEIIITGSDRDDRLVVDFSNPFALPISFDGGGQSSSRGDSLEVIGDGKGAGSITVDARKGGSGTIEFVGSTINFAGLEPTSVTAMSSYTFTTTGSEDNLTIDSPGAGQNRISGTSDGTPFEALTFDNIPDFTIDTGTNDSGSPNDTITINSNLVAAQLQNLTITTGAGDDTLTIHTNNFQLPVSGGSFTYNGGTGNDTIDFNASSGGYTQTLTAAKSGSDSVLTGADGSAITLQSGTVENIVNVNVAKDTLLNLLDDMEKVSDWTRTLAADAQFASQLPLIFAGDSVSASLGNLMDFADAIDAVRSKIHEYYNNLGNATDFTLDSLETMLKSIADNVAHNAGSIVGDFAPTLTAGDTANIKISLDGGTEQTLSFTGGPDLNTILGKINAAITGNSTLNGKVLAYDAEGHVAFKTLDPNVVSYAVSCDGTNNAFSKLGLRTSQTLKAAGISLSSLTGAANELVQNATDGITIDPLTLLPKLNIKLPFSLSRVPDLTNHLNTFGLDFGKEVRDLKGINFDASAELGITTTITGDFEFGLTIGASPAFEAKLSNLSAGVAVNGNLSADVSFGFLGAHAAGTVNLEAGLSLAPITLTLNDLQTGNLSGVSLTPSGNSAFSADLNVSVLGGLTDPNVSGTYNPSGLTLTLSGANPFDPSTFGFDKFTQVGDFTDLFNFSNLTPSGMVTLLNKIASSFDDAANSNLFSSFNIPFVSSALSDALDIVKTAQKAILFDSGPDGADNGTALITDLNSALAKAGLASRFLVQGDGTSANGTTVTLLATDGSITAFSASGLAAVGLDGNATGQPLKLTGTPVNNGVLASDGTLALSITDGTGTHTVNVQVTKSATADNTRVGNDIPKLVNASGAPTFRTAQEFADHLITLLNLASSVIKASYDSAANVLTFHLKYDANLPDLTFPISFNLPLGSFGGFQSTGSVSITPDAGIDLTFGVDLGAGGNMDDTTQLANLSKPVQVPNDPAFTGSDLTSQGIVGNLSGDANFTITYSDPTTVNVTVPKLIGQPGTDIDVTPELGDQAETTIVVNPTDPRNMIIGVNDNNPDNGIFGSDRSRDAVWVTKDGGQHWDRVEIPLPENVPDPLHPGQTLTAVASHGDPTIVFNRAGLAVYSHLVHLTGTLGADNKPGGVGANEDGAHTLATAVSTDGGLTWTPALVPTTGDSDKEFLAVGPVSGDVSLDRFVLAWQQRNVIFASTSLNGSTWTTPVIVGGVTFGTSATDLNALPAGSSISSYPAIGPNGEIYVVWEDFRTPGFDRLTFDVSLDGGDTWGAGHDTKVFYNAGESDLDSGDKLTLDQAVNYLKSNAQLIVTVAGYTDTVDTQANNQTLSEARAQKVVDYLVSQGIDKSRIAQVAFNETQLAVQTGNGVANDQNRRVELTFDQVIYTSNINPFHDLALITGASQKNPVEITSSQPHGLTTGAQVLINNIVGMTELNGRQFTITVTGPNTFTLNGENGTVGHTAYVSGGSWIQAGTITGATNAKPVVITTGQDHHLVDGDIVRISQVGGMLELNDGEELNGGNFRITVIDNTHFSLDNTDGTNFGTYTNGGTWQKTGTYSIAAQPLRGIGTNASIDVDRSGGAKNGRIYISFIDQADFDGDNDRLNPTDHDDTDIFLIASDDHGATWNALASSPRAVHADQVRVNDDDPTSHSTQFMPWLDIDQSTGNLAIAWLDARLDDGSDPGNANLTDGDVDGVANNDVEYFTAISFDFGMTWTKNQQVSDQPSSALGNRFNYGEYNGLAFVNNTLQLSWSDTSNSALQNPDLSKSLTDTYYDQIKLTNTSIADLIADINMALADYATVPDGPDPDTLPDPFPLNTKFKAVADGNVVKIETIDPAITQFTLATTNTDPAFRDLGFPESAEGQPGGSLVVKAGKPAPTLIGRLPSDAEFTIAMANNGPSDTITVNASATADDRTILDLLSDVKNALAASSPLNTHITVESEGNSLVFKSTDATAFTITAGTGADKLGLGAPSTVDQSNAYDLLITLSDGSTYNVALKKDDGTPCTTMGDVRDAIDRDTSHKVTIAFNAQNTALQLTDTTFVSFVGTQANPNPAMFRIKAANGSDAGGKLGIIASDAAGAADKPDGVITGAPVAGKALLDRLFIQEPGQGDPAMLHASLGVSTGGGISGKVNFGFVGLDFTGTGAIDAGIGASLKDPGTSPGTVGKITIAEIVQALGSDPIALLAAPTIQVDPNHLGHDSVKLTLSANTGVAGFTVGGLDAWVNFQIKDFAPTIVPTYGSGITDLINNFGNLSFDNILAVLKQIIIADPDNPHDGLAGFLSAGPLGSFKIPLLDVSLSDLVSSVDKFTSALVSMEQNPAGSLQTLAEKLTEALGVPTTLSLVSNKFLQFSFDFSDAISKGLSLKIPDNLLNIPGFTLSGSAGLNFAANMDLGLDFGIDLSQLTSNPLTLPDIWIYTGSGHTGFSGTATVTGSNLSFLAGIGPLAVSIENGSASINGTFSISTADNDGTNDGKVLVSNFLGSLSPSLIGTISANLPVAFSGLSIGSIGIADFNANPDGSVAADLADAIADFPSFITDDIKANLTLPNLADISLFDNLALSAEGLDVFLGGLQDLLTGNVFSTTIPIIGDQLAKGGQFIGKLRNDFVAPFRQAMETAKNAAQNFADPKMNVISGLLFDILGPGTMTSPGIDLLQKLSGHTGSAQEDYVELITNLDKYLAGQIPQDETKIEWDFTLGGDYNLGPNINFDIGLPGLGLAMDGTVNVDLHWTLHLGIGFDFNDGFYLVIGNPDNPNDTTWTDLDVGLQVDFSDDFGLTGKLAFLQIDAKNDFSVYTVNDSDYGFSGTGITADFAIDLTNSANPASNHLGFADIGSLDVTPQVKAAAALELGLTLGLNPGVVGPGVASGMPKIKADFILDWALDGDPNSDGLQFMNFSDVGGDAMQAGLKLVEFKNLRLDVGSFVSDVLGPIVQKVKEVTEPIQPIIEIITTPIPVISDLAGSPITLLDLAASFGEVDPGMIYALADIIDFVNSIPDPGATSNLEIPLLGTTPFKIFEANNFTFAGIHLSQPNFDLGAQADSLIGNVQGDLSDLKSEIGSMNTGGNSANEAAKNALSGMLGGKGSAGKADRGFSFPLFDNPSQIFYLLMGKQSDLALAEYRLPVLDFKFDYSQFFPIFGPLGVSITGTVGLRIDLGFGYDTKGIREFIDSKAKHPELLVDGFYLTDLDKSGNDVPELEFFGGIAAAAECNLVIAEAGVAGGIGVTVDFNLHDNDHDGKVRLDELIGNIYDEAVLNNDPVLAPLAIFDVSGKVFAQLSAFLKIDLFFWSFSQTWNITPEITLADFSFQFNRVPKLATLSDSGELRLNMGTYAKDRLNGDLNDGAEDFTVTHSGGLAGDEIIQVTSTLGGGTQTYNHVKKLIIEGGEGVDNITVNGVQSPMEISGGAGDDVINLSGSMGKATIHGDAGNDSITGGDGDDVIYGGLGTDTIHGGGGRDIIFGDGETLGDTFAEATIAGNDSNDALYGDDGDDIIFGAGGDDTIQGGAGNDLLIGDAGSVALVKGTITVDWTKGVTGTMTAKNGGKDEIHGGSGDDSIFGEAGDDKLYGDDDNDRIFGEAGFDTIEGGAGDDIIFGDGWTLLGTAQLNDTFPAKGIQPATGGEADDIKGGDGDDIIFAGGGNDLVRGEAGNDSIYGGTGADSLFGDGNTFVGNVLQETGTDGNDTIYGQSENDTIYGGGGNDLLSGDGGNDVIYGGSGTDSIFGGFGSDTLDGQTDGDQYFIYTRGGNETALTTVYDSGAAVDNDFMTIYGTAENDVFLLRAMADAYIPELDKLHTLIEKTYNLAVEQGSDVLATIQQAITKAYAPNTVPTGMLGALATQFGIDSTPSGLSALETSIDSSYVPTPHRTGFVAKLNNDGKAIERFNYRGIEKITLNTLYGDDYVASDDTLADFEINGGVGNDRFQIGQVFKSQRDDNPDTANLSGDDMFATLEITRGWLSNGISKSMIINGGDGNDEFTVFHNKKPLTLNGGDGDDTFTVRAFALVGSVDSERARTDMKGDAGADTIRYAVNAPVGIDGGDGFDTVIVIGTEFSDDFVVTDQGVFGAGLNVTYMNIEKLKVDGAEGDDRYFVLSTDANIVTEIDGGLGSDTFFVGGSPSDAPIYVTSNDLRGYNGIILHDIENTGTEYDGAKIDAVVANVADNDEPFIVVSESGGFSSVTEDISSATAGVSAEGWDYDTYTVTLTSPLKDSEEVHVHVLPQEPSPEDEAKGFKMLQFLKPGTQTADPSLWTDSDFADDITLTFNAAGSQTVFFRAAHDDTSEGKQFVIINNDVDSEKPDSTPGSYDGLAVRSVKVQVNDDDRAGAIVTRTARPLQVIEGNTTFDQEYAVLLTRAPSDSVTVTLDPFFDQVTLSGSTLTWDSGTKTGTLTFDGTNYNHAQFVTVTALDDPAKEGFHTDYISHTLTSLDKATTQTRSRYQLDGDPDVAGVNDIPAEKPLDTLLTMDKPTGNVQVWVDNVLRDSSRYVILGNTLVFLGADLTTPEAISGKVEVQYDYTVPGYDGAPADRQVVDIADNEVASVVVMESDGSTDVIEGGATDTYQIVLTKQPSADVTIHLDSINTRTGALDPDTLQPFAFFEKHVKVNGVLSTTLTFNADSNGAHPWNVAQTVTVSAIDDSKIDGDETQAFVPSIPTVNKIRGPLFVEGASGSGSLSLPAPLLLPLPQQELNIHPTDGTVVSFTPSANPGPGAIDQMVVSTAALQTVVTKLNDPKIHTVADLVGKTLELTKGPGTGIVLDSTQPRNLYDRFWLITDVTDLGGGYTQLTLQNPSQVDTTNPAVTAPDSTTSYAITSLSINFFADERKQVDYLFVFDQGSVADKTGRLTSSDGMVTGFVSSAGNTETMTVSAADLEAAAKSLAGGINDLVNKTLRISVGPGIDRTWQIAAISNVSATGTRDLTLTKLGGSTEVPTNLSEYTIDGTIVKGRITGLGMGPNAVISGFADPGGVRYGDLETVQVNLGTGNDNLTIDYTTFWKDHTTKRDNPFYTLTMVNTGLGDDTVTVNLADGRNGAISINTQEGNDHVFGQGSTLPLVVFGWDGNDEIRGGSGADILFGDQGRVDYLNGDGEIITRLGQTVPQNPVNPPVASPVTSAALTKLTDSTANYAVNVLVGFTVQAIAPDGTAQLRTISANTATELTISSAWTTTPTSDYSYRILFNAANVTIDGIPRATLTDPLGNFETAYGGLVGLMVQAIAPDGTVQFRRVISNTSDTLTLDKPWDVIPVVADPTNHPEKNYFYRISALPENQTDGQFRGPHIVWSIDGNIGGTDSLEGGGGADVIVGGAGKDTVSAGAGDDWVAGDNARFDYVPVSGNDGPTMLSLVQTTETAYGDNDTMNGDADKDVLIGGTGDDTADGGGQTDIVLGDQGVITFLNGKISLVQDPGPSGNDTLAGGPDLDLIIGGLGNDTISGNGGPDILIGDEADVNYAADGVTILQINTTDRTHGGVDTIYGNDQDDILIGGTNADNLDGGLDQDLIFGDNVLLTLNAGSGDAIDPRFRALTGTTIYDGNDLAQVSGQFAFAIQPVPGGRPAWGDWTIMLDQTTTAANFGNDYIAGGGGNDEIFGQRGNDTIQGDGSIDSKLAPVDLSPAAPSAVVHRLQLLNGGVVSSSQSFNGATAVNGAADTITLTAHGFSGGETVVYRNNGLSNVGGLVNLGLYKVVVVDVNTIRLLAPVDAARRVTTDTVNAAGDQLTGLLLMTPSFGASTDGDDYIEGNSGNDVIFGNLGQDDIIGGSSNLFSLTATNLRDDGSDLIFGGPGTDAGRNDPGDTSATGHARDADVILTDNGNIFRLVGVNGQIGVGATGIGFVKGYLAFNYDNYSSSLRIIPRAAQLLEYTPGGFDFNAAGAATDIGAADEVHGGQGDDFIYGMVGNDVLFGDGQNDVIIGGYGADWISGGTGDDGILGDDGLIKVSRNSSSYGEPLYGISAIAATDINRLVVTSDGVNNGIINVDGALKYTADLTPQNLQPNQVSLTAPDPLFPPLYANDIIYGGWGNDSIHAGAGDDAISGAEAPAVAYTNSYTPSGTKLNGAPIESDFSHPYNPGTVLGYQTGGANATKFDLYDANDPLRTIMLTATGTLWKGTGTSYNWILNFSETEGPADTYWIQGQTKYKGVPTDGDDHIFGDLGNDWCVGGTGRDTIYAGWGDDLLNLDDNLNSAGTTSKKGNTFDPNPDTNPSYEDMAFGGAGLDVLLVNTNGDRAMDWIGEFNSFFTPFSQYGAVSVSRLLRPTEPQYLYDMSKSDGADQTLAAQYGSDPTRNGEPFGELGLVLQKDAAWGAQSGSPRDPQPGNTGGASVDIKNQPGTVGTKPIYETAEGPAPTTDSIVLLTNTELAPIVAEAEALWKAALGAGDSRLAALDDLQVIVGNLPQDRLAVTMSNTIVIDADAAGFGWFVDATPENNAEFAAVGPGGELVASATSPAYGEMDLLTVLMHEIGHVLGYDDIGPAASTDLMSGTLEEGVRRLPGELETSLTPLAWDAVDGSLQALDSTKPLAGVTGFTVRAVPASGNGTAATPSAASTEHRAAIEWTGQYVAALARIHPQDDGSIADPILPPVEVQLAPSAKDKR